MLFSIVLSIEWTRNKEPNDHAFIIAEEIKARLKENSKVLFLSKFEFSVYRL